MSEKQSTYKIRNNTKNINSIKGVYLGDRNKAFKRLITHLLKQSKIKQKYIDILTDNESLKEYACAFTSEQVDENNNYQVYEQIGDLSGNKFIINYFYKRFPQLRCAEGVKVAARLRVNYGSKNSFSSLAEKYGFWDFITATNDLRHNKKEALLEDVFEAFLGVTESILDNRFKVPMGYACVYKILSFMFDQIPISLKYEDLYDAKTRLKELFDLFSDKLGVLKYEEKKENLSYYIYIFRIKDREKIPLAESVERLKSDAEQSASAKALELLKDQGYIKHPPSIYTKFSESIRSNRDNCKLKPTELKDISKLIHCDSQDEKILKENINNQFYIKGKTKYQSCYTSTALVNYCRKRDLYGVKICLELGADINIPDSDGLTPMDVLLIGQEDSNIEEIYSLMSEHGTISAHKNVLEAYNIDPEGFNILDA